MRVEPAEHRVAVLERNQSVEITGALQDPPDGSATDCGRQSASRVITMPTRTSIATPGNAAVTCRWCRVASIGSTQGFACRWIRSRHHTCLGGSGWIGCLFDDERATECRQVAG